MTSNYIIRRAKTEDYFFLREMLYLSIFIPVGKERPPFSIIDTPEIYKYIKGWMNEDDLGFIAEVENISVGAAWARLFKNKETGGYGFIDRKTPELALAVDINYREMGLGTKLMEHLLNESGEKRYQQISLSVDQANHNAIVLYKKLGFKIIQSRETDYLMIKQLSPTGE